MNFFKLVQTAIFALCGALFLGLSGAHAQQIPNHSDASQHEDVFDLARVPSIRFLTTSDFPPFNFEDAGGNLIGFNVDLAKALCAEIKVDCTMQAWPWAQLETAMKNGQGDAAIAGLAIDEANAAKYLFSGTYLKLPARFVGGMADLSDFEPTTITKEIGVRDGSRHMDFLANYFPQLKLKPFENELAIFEALQSGELSFGFVDGMRASFWLNQTECCQFLGGPYFESEYFGAGLAVAVSTDLPDVKRVINIGLRRLNEKGKFAELYLKWFPVGFY